MQRRWDAGCERSLLISDLCASAFPRERILITAETPALSEAEWAAPKEGITFLQFDLDLRSVGPIMKMVKLECDIVERPKRTVDS